MEPVAHVTLQERIFRQITDLILNGEIAPGEIITIQSLANAFGVSTMPVREALIRLTANGALTTVTGRTVGVPKLTLAQLKELRNVRKEIEGLAATWAAINATGPQIDRMRRLCDDLEKAVNSEDVKAYLRLNREFHFAVYGLAQSPTLVTLIETLWLRISPYFNLLHESGNYVISNTHHRKLLEALETNQPAQAREAVASDIQDAYAVLATLVE
ncbi:MAG: GntR family transcriptional regulator [Rhodobacteraceae bacterium]|nr:GntR family transcriptional regulator [Paracoccaceae bacterium]